MVIRDEWKIFCQPPCCLCRFLHMVELLLISQNNLNVDHGMSSGMAFTSIENWQNLHGREGNERR